MIKFFRQSYIIQYIFIAMIAIAIWIPSFITVNVDAAYRSPVAPLYNLFADLLDFWKPAMLLFAFLLMAFNVMFFNSLLTSNQLIGKVNTLGALVYLLLMNLLPEQTTFYPFLLASVFLLMFIHTLFAIYQTPHPELYLLNAGFYLSFATMCYFPSLLLALWGVIALGIVRRGSFRLHLIPFLGLLLPYFFYFAAHYLMGDWMEVLQRYGDFFQSIQLSVLGFNKMNIIMLAFLLLVCAMPMLMPHLYAFEKSIAVRTKTMMTVILLFFGLFMLFLGTAPIQTGVVFIALSILFSYEAAYLEKLKWSNITLWVFLLLVLASHYVPLFVRS